jgi:hypothetical protein
MDKSYEFPINRLLQLLAIYCGFLFAFTASGSELDIEAMEKRSWYKGVSQNITVYTDMQPRKVVALLDLLENFAAYCQIIFSVPPDNRDFSMTLFVAGKSKTWEALGGDRLTEYRAWVDSQSTIAFINTGSGFTGVASNRSPARMSLYKSVADLQIQKSPHAAYFPFWYRNGMARYMATFERLGDKVSVGQLGSVSGRLFGLLPTLKREYEYDLSEVITRTSLPARSEGEHSSDYLERANDAIALNLMLVHYFYADANRQMQLNRYLTLLEQGFDHQEAMFAATDLSFEQLGEALYEYLNSRKLYAQTFNFSDVDAMIKEVQGDSFAKTQVEPIEASTVVDAVMRLSPFEL